MYLVVAGKNDSEGATKDDTESLTHGVYQSVGRKHPTHQSNTIPVDDGYVDGQNVCKRDGIVPAAGRRRCTAMQFDERPFT